MGIAAGSAMAANCEPCLNMVIPNLVEVAVPDAEIRSAVEIGQYVKDRKADIMKEAADILADTSLLDKDVPEECTSNEMELLRDDKVSMLIAVGAAVAGNCESCLNAVIPELKKEGATDAEIRGAVDIGLTVKERPAALVAETADKLISKPSIEEYEVEEDKDTACAMSLRFHTRWPDRRSLTAADTPGRQNSRQTIRCGCIRMAKTQDNTERKSQSVLPSPFIFPLSYPFQSADIFESISLVKRDTLRGFQVSKRHGNGFVWQQSRNL